MPPTAKKRPGRPPKPEGERGGNFSIRLLPEVREALEAAATKAGRSLSAEIGFRLQQTLTIEGLLDDGDTIETVISGLQETRRKLDDTERRLDTIEQRDANLAYMKRVYDELAEKVAQIERMQAARVAAKKK